MQFLHQWFPLIVTIREGIYDDRELTEMSAGFESYFRLGERYAVLAASHVAAEMPDAIMRIRVAEWLNQPRVRQASHDLCVGSATVVARDWERHSLTALQWLWAPVSPHEAVDRVSEGIDYCIDRLVEAKVPLSVSPELLRADVYRGLLSSNLAGMDDATPGCQCAPPRRKPLRQGSDSTTGRFETLADSHGSVVFGWLVPGVLWGKFAGHVSETLCVAYANRLGEVLRSASNVSYFLDSRALEGCDAAGRNAAVCALVENAGHLARVITSPGAEQVDPASRATMQSFGSNVHVVENYQEFDALLFEAAPQAEQIFASNRSAADTLPGTPG